ncbi:MAG: hypothetical protein UW24_C0010G0009 [Parcubacteria group bacterium GW2011_GWA2_44_12]|nr:MAG: hypothetical protein UW24_C0010G0009 [Parcubacteria group bacterium GW2011_GWA2_44_12]
MNSLIRLYEAAGGKIKKFFSLFNTFHRSKRSKLAAITAFLFCNALILGLLSFYDLKALQSAGYAGLFISVFLVSVVAFLPFPIGILILSYFFMLNPFAVALVGGTAAALGSIGPYFLGLESKELLQKNKLYKKLHDWIEPKPKLVVLFLASFIPNPLFDTFTVTGGAFGVPLKKFFWCVFFGKVLCYLIAAALFPYVYLIAPYFLNAAKYFAF